MAIGRGVVLRIIVFFVSIFSILNFFFKVPVITTVAASLERMTVPLFALALILGSAAVSVNKARSVIRRTRYWQYNAVGLASMLAVMVSGFLDPAPQAVFRWLNTNVIATAQVAMASTLGFWVASAAYRSLRMRTAETTLLMLSALTVILGLAPIGTVLFGPSATAAAWVMDVPTMAATRGLNVAATIGTFAFALRVYLGREKLILN